MTQNTTPATSAVKPICRVGAACSGWKMANQIKQILDPIAGTQRIHRRRGAVPQSCPKSTDIGAK